MVPHRDRDGPLVDGERHHNRLALAVLDRIADEVAQDALGPARIHLGDHRCVRDANLYLLRDAVGDRGRP